MSVYRLVSCSSVAAAVLTAVIALVLLRRFEDELIAIDMHIGLSFRWTVLALPGIGAIIGTLVGWFAIFFLKSRNRLHRDS